MNKHENMVKKNKEVNREKVEMAISCINDLLKDDKQVVVCELVRRTGLSRAFFYNNATVKAELDRAQELQSGKSFVVPQKVVIDKAMEKELELMKRKLSEKDVVILQLQMEIAKMRKASNARNLSIIKGL